MEYLSVMICSILICNLKLTSCIELKNQKIETMNVSMYPSFPFTTSAILLFRLVSTEPVTDLKIPAETANQILPTTLLLLNQVSTGREDGE